MTISVGSVSVSIVPETTRFAAQLRSQVLPDADRVGQDIGKALADRIARGIKDGLGDGFRGTATESAAKGRESGGAFADAFRSKLEAALRALPKVDIDADSSPAERKIQELRARLLELSDKKVGIDISEADVRAKIASIHKDLVELGNKSPSIQIRMDAAKAVTELAAFEGMVKKLDGKNVNIDVKADTGAAEGKLAALGATAAAAGGGGGLGGLALAGIALGPAIIPVAAAATAAVAGIGLAAAGALAGAGVLFLALKPVIGAVQALSQADAQSATNAAASAAAARSKANAIAGANAQVQSSEASLSNTRESVASAAVNADQRVADAQRALGSTRESVANAAVTADQRVSDAQRALGTARASVAAAEVNAAQRVADAERALQTTRDSVAAAAVNAAQRVSDARRSLRDAEQQAAAGIQTALAQVASAERALANAQQQAAQGVQTALAQVTSAERTLAQAQAQELTAQQELTGARKAAQQQLQDYQTQLADGALAQRGALLSIQRAKENLDKVNSAAGSTQLQRDEAKLAYDEAVQHNADLGIQQERLRADAAAAAKAGVDGSRQVVAAQDRIVAANEQVHTSEQGLAAARAAVTAAQVKGTEQVRTAEQSLGTAHAAVTAARVKGDEQVARAQEAVGTAQRVQAAQALAGSAQIVKAQEAIGTAQRAQADQARTGAAQIVTAEEAIGTARRAQAEQARTGADQVAKAEEAITTARRAQADQARTGAAQIAAAQAAEANAVRALQVAHEQTSAAGVSGANKVAQAFKGLTPAGAEFARFLYGLKDAFTGLSGAAQDGLLPGLQEAIRGLLPALPGLTRFVGDLARVMGDLFVQASKALSGPFWTQFFDFLSGSAAGWLKTFAETFGQLVKGAAGLFQALAPVGELFNSSLLAGATAFANWATSLGTNTGFQTFLGYIRANLPPVLGFLGDLWNLGVRLVQALAPLGPVVLGVVDSIVRFVASLSPDQLRLIAGAIGAVVLGMAAFGPVTSAIGAVASAIGPLTAALGALLSPVGLVIAGIALLVAGVVYAYFHFTEFRRVVDAAVAGIVGAIGTFLSVAIPIVQQFVDGMRARIEPLMPQIRAIFGQIGDIIVAALNLIQAVIEFATKAISFIWTNFGQGIMDWIGVVFRAVIGIIGPALETVKSVIKLFTDVLHGNWSAAWQDVIDILNHTADVLNAIVKGFTAVILQTITSVWNAVRDHIFVVNDAIVGKIYAVNDAIRNKIFEVNDNIRSKIFEFNDAIRDRIYAINDAIRDKIFSVNDAIRDFLLARWADIQNNATAWWSGITGSISRIWDGLLGWMHEKVTGLQGFLSGAWDTIQGGASTAWQSIVDTIGGIWGKVVENFKGPLNTVLGFIQDHFITPLQTLLDTLHVSIKLPTVPQFATGGPVGPRVDYSNKPRGYDTGGTVFGWSPHERADNIPAMLTAGEFILPVAATNALRAQGGDHLLESLRQGVLGSHADGGLIRGYADGGSVWDAIKTGLGVAASQTGNPVATIASAVTSNPLDAIKKMVASIVAGIGSGPFPQIAGGVLTQAGDALAQQVKDFLSGQSQNGASSIASDGAGATSAVNWALGNVGTGGWLDKCLAFVNAAWGHKVGWLGLPRAIDSWNAAPGRHPGDTNPPAGAALFYTTGNPAGHVDLAVGQNSIVSTDLPIRDKLGQGPFNMPMSQWGANYLGWAIPGGSTAAAGGAGSGNVAFSPGAGVLQWANTVQQALGMEGQDSSLGGITLRRMNQESGGNPNAINLWDSNAKAGTPSKGLMQVIDPTFNANWDPRTPHDIWNPLSNIAASMKYALRQYGSLSSAYGRAGGYADGGAVAGRSVLKPILLDTGGTIPPGRSLVDNQTGDWEHLTRTDQIGGPVVVNVIDRDGSFVDRMRGEIVRADQHAQLVAAAGSSVAIR